MSKPCCSTDTWVREHHDRCSVSEEEWVRSPFCRTWSLEKRMHDPDDHGAIDGWCVDIPDPVEFVDGCRYISCYTAFFYDDERSARLAAAAPALVRALLSMEWKGRVDWVGDGGWDCCPICDGVSPYDDVSVDAVREIERGMAVRGHKPECALDAALTAAGIATSEERDAARREMGR